MRLLRHGGACCGMRQLVGFFSKPDQVFEAVTEPPVTLTSAYSVVKNIADSVMSHEDIVWPSIGIGKPFEMRPAELPKQTSLERLDMLLEHYDKDIKYGVIEAVLATGWVNNNQLTHWRPILEERGFKFVTKCRNSNTHNDLYIFHRAKDLPA